MSKFVLKISIFIFALFIALLSFVLINRYFGNFKSKKEFHIIILGHSHSECAYNDSLINGVANFSQSGESYFYTFFKTKKLIEQNPNINTVLIEFSNNQISEPMNNWIWDDKYMSYRFPKYGAFMDLNAYQLLYEKNAKCFMNSTKILLKNSIKNIFTGLKFQKDIGGYLYLERDKTDSLISNIPVHSNSENYSQPVSEYNIEYLQKTIKYLTSNNKRVILIRSPLHTMYSGYNNEHQFQELLKTKFSEIEFMDFSKFPLLNSEFGDLEHLNHKGASRFSIWFNQLLNNKILKRTDKQIFIDRQMTN